MKISVTAPTSAMADYLRVVADQIEGAFLGGHVDAQTHWTTEEVYDND